MFALRMDQVKQGADQQLATTDRRAGNLGHFSGAGLQTLQDLFHGFCLDVESGDVSYGTANSAVFLVCERISIRQLPYLWLA